jgi:mono/diheme cytochrome c family protein
VKGAALLALAALAALAACAVLGPSRAEMERGARLWTAKGCHGCHTLDGRIGTPMAPDLGGIGTRRGREWLETWLRDPAALHPRVPMPRIEMTADEADALAAYLAARP